MGFEGPKKKKKKKLWQARRACDIEMATLALKVSCQLLFLWVFRFELEESSLNEP